MIKGAYILFVLTVVSCSPIKHLDWQQSLSQIKSFNTVTDHGILISVFQNDSIQHFDNARLPKTAVVELGDLTQIFSALEVIEKAQKGKFSLSDKINVHLPPALQSSSLAHITIQDCLSHRTGLPRIPSNIGLTQQDKNQPFEHYAIASFENFIASWSPIAENKKYQYSLIGYVLLDQAFDITGGVLEAQNVIQGHNRIGMEVDPLKPNLFKAAVGGKASFEDLEIQLAQWITAPSSTFKQSTQVIAPTGIDGQTSMASGWHVYKIDKNYSMILQTGATPGHSIFIAICLQSQTGVVIAAPKKVNLGPMGYYIMSKLNNGWKRPKQDH